MSEKPIGWWSAGITSAVACKLAILKYGEDNIDLYYIGISSAHDDNARFKSDCEKWYKKEIKTISSKKYADQFEVIEETGQVNSAYGAACTTHLKKNVRLELQAKLNNPIQIFGFEFSLKEINRSIRFTEQWPDAKAEFPLIENKTTKEECADILERNGIELPAMYKLGFANNNCIGCVKGSKGYWNHIRKTFPDVFAKMAITEREAGHSCNKENFFINRAMTVKEYIKFEAETLDPKGRWSYSEIDGFHYAKNGEIGDIFGEWWVNKMDSRPVFLDTLKISRGRPLKPIVPDCGSLCEIKHVDIISNKAKEIWRASV